MQRTLINRGAAGISVSCAQHQRSGAIERKPPAAGIGASTAVGSLISDDVGDGFGLRILVRFVRRLLFQWLRKRKMRQCVVRFRRRVNVRCAPPGGPRRRLSQRHAVIILRKP